MGPEALLSGDSSPVVSMIHPSAGRAARPIMRLSSSGAGPDTVTHGCSIHLSLSLYRHAAASSAAACGGGGCVSRASALYARRPFPVIVAVFVC